MIKLWLETGFGKVLYKAWQNGKVICGISAGAVCWFKECNSEYFDETEKFNTTSCLNWFNLFATPHCDENGRLSSTKKQLKKTNQIGIMLSNKAAIEIIDDKYKILLNRLDAKEPYILKSYWKNGKYYEKRLTNENEFLSIETLYSKEN